MKIPPANPLPARPSPEANRGAATSRRGPAQSASAADSSEPLDASEAGAATPERDFASVLEEVSRPDERQDDAGEGDRRDARSTERTEHETEARRREDREGGDSSGGGNDSKGGGFEQRAGVRETATSVGEATGARAILHIADLERIVSAVRAQSAADGGREVMIELRRSVLEGLRVRLSTDAGGRVTAEFVAASERVRSQLDARTTELAELLRGRGVNLAALRTSVEAGGGGSTAERGPRGGRDVSPPVRDARVVSPSESSADSVDDEGGAAANTYRA